MMAVSAGPSLEERIESGLNKQFGEGSMGRVLDSLKFTGDGKEYEKEWPGQGKQQANSYIEGLTATPWHDPQAPEFKWAAELEKHWETVQSELAAALASNPKVKPSDTSDWVAAVRGDALAYGPEWRTLVLQDRGRWDENHTALFPKTTKLLKKLNVPSSEIFFASQTAHTGIKPHTDNTNFILTGHLGLMIPEGECWIQVGDHKRYWEEGKSMIMDTSFIHSTANETDSVRYVLIFRFWHPELTQDEINALLYVFECLDMPEGITEGNWFKETQKNLQRRVKKSSKTASKSGGFGGGGGGFGSR